MRPYLTTACCLLAMLTGIAATPASAAQPPAKRAVAVGRLLLPLFEVDMTDPDGPSTFFSVRNETTQPVDVRISYHAADRPQTSLHTATVTLSGKQLRSFNVRAVPNLLLDSDGFARGFVRRCSP